MKKQLIIIGIIILLIAVGLSGCQENNISDNLIDASNEVQLVSHSIRIAQGWCDIPNGMQVMEVRLVSGTIKNIAGRNIDTVYVRVRFYDWDNKLLFTSTTTVSYLGRGLTDDFSVQYCSNEPYYETYDHYTIEVLI